MKSTITSILCAFAVAMAAVSCQTEKINPSERAKGTVEICVNGLMPEYSADVKSELVNTMRVSWKDGDVVYVYDGTKCLGSLVAALDGDENRYAKLSTDGSHTVSEPEEGTTMLTLVHSPLLTEAPGVSGNAVSISLAGQNSTKAPFVAYATLDYTGATITDVVVPFQFATSVIKVNCTGLKASTAIDNATLSNVNTACRLTLSGSAAPTADGDANGSITRTGDAYFDASKVNEEGVAVFQIAVPVLGEASEARVLTMAQGSDEFEYKNFPKKSLSAATSVNTVCQLVPYVPVESVSLDRASVYLAKGWTVTLKATVSPDDATYKNVTWSSDNTSAATVDENGRVTAVAEGEANITVTTLDGGKTAACRITVGDFVLPGEFTVNAEGKKVHFSKGNLYYDRKNWGFEQEQYYFRTYDGKGKCDASGYSSSSGTASGHWGLFGWSTGANTYGMSTSISTDDYLGNFRDWGTAIDNKGTWRTLSGGSEGEWKYLFDHHVNVWGTCNSVPGRFIAPDGFVGDEDALKEAIKDWDSAQAAGIVFLPAAGYRNGSNVSHVGDNGYCWSSSAYDESRAYSVFFGSLSVSPDDDDYRDSGYSVRLITDVK